MIQKVKNDRFGVWPRFGGKIEEPPIIFLAVVSNAENTKRAAWQRQRVVGGRKSAVTGFAIQRHGVAAAAGHCVEVWWVRQRGNGRLVN